MKRWLQRLGEKMQVWMYGRYGYDELSHFLSVTALICLLISMFVSLLYPIALILLIWSMFRIFSRNIEKRLKEREAYLKYAGKVKRSFKLRKDMWRDRKTHRYYKCPNCKNWLRVPKGKGQIEITCPVCKNKITRKT